MLNFQHGKEAYAYRWKRDSEVQDPFPERGSTTFHHSTAWPIDDDLSDTNDPSGLNKSIYLQALGKRDKNVKDLHNTKQVMYADSFDMISEKSKIKL